MDTHVRRLNPFDRLSPWHPTNRRRRSVQRLYDDLLRSGQLKLEPVPGGRIVATMQTGAEPRSYYVGSPEFAEAVAEFAVGFGWHEVDADILEELEERLAEECPLEVPETVLAELDEQESPEAPAAEGSDLLPLEPVPTETPLVAAAEAPQETAPDWDESVLPVRMESEDERLERALRGVARGGAWIGRPSSLALACGDDPYSVAEALVRNHRTLTDRGLRVMTRPLGRSWVWVVLDEGLALFPNLPPVRVRDP